MSGTRSIRAWGFVHKWTSLICTVFLLFLCLTGLPLIFREEIDDLLSPRPESHAPASPNVTLDSVIASALRQFPDNVPRFLFWDHDHPDQVRLILGKTVTAPPAHRLIYDLRSGTLIDQLRPGLTVTGFILKLHTDAFLDLPGALFFGAMGLLFFAAMVSGIILYGPFTKKLPFGIIRGERSRRVQWLDFHNLMGILTLVWGSVVCLTGALNTLTVPMVGNFQKTDLAAILSPYRLTPSPTRAVSVDAALAAALATTPDAKPFSIIFPGSTSATSPHHYAVYIVGNGPITSRMFQPVLVEASTGAVTAKVDVPWYLNMLLVSRPIHYGDYGGLPLKIIWAVLDIISIVLLASGLYLWLAKRPTQRSRPIRLAQPPGAR